MLYFWAVPASFGLCSALFLLLSLFGGFRVEPSCSRVSAFHHFVAMLLGMWVHWEYRERMGTETAVFGANSDFPHAVLLQHFNLGYFLYDTVHVVVWDQKFLVHHLVAIAGYASSEVANVFGLANAVNTWITELGSLMYSAYLVFRTDRFYVGFVLFYTVTRVYFALWSADVVRHAINALQGKSLLTYPFWAPYCSMGLQLALLVVNLLFLATHWRKLWRRYIRGEATKERQD
mmetsp:Transcript_107781/g.310384  ORF Transcript_107781/g.310384 Transcript_107781/m.310384 type:complete len:233 (-) Transcript_107781:79-777(-)